MGRLNAIFIAFCMVLIAASAGIVSWLAVSFTGMEATVLAVAVMTALVLMNSVTGRQRDRYDMGGQIADLSRATADIGRQVSELDRRLVGMEGEVAAAMDRTRSATEPLASEIDELGGLVKELADAVAAHEQMLESAIANATPPRPAAAPALAPDPFERPAAAERSEPGAPRMPASGPFRGMEVSAIVAQIARAVEANRVDLFLQPIVTLPQRKVRYYEALARLRNDDGSLISPDDFLGPAEGSGLMPAIDNLMVFRAVQVVRRLSTKNREVGLFCNMSAVDARERNRVPGDRGLPRREQGARALSGVRVLAIVRARDGADRARMPGDLGRAGLPLLDGSHDGSARRAARARRPRLPLHQGAVGAAACPARPRAATSIRRISPTCSAASAST